MGELEEEIWKGLAKTFARGQQLPFRVSIILTYYHYHHLENPCELVHTDPFQIEV